jgi:hypothetical protein
MDPVVGGGVADETPVAIRATRLVDVEAGC